MQKFVIGKVRSTIMFGFAAALLLACSPPAPAPTTPAAPVRHADIVFRRADGLITLWRTDGATRTGSVALDTIGAEWTLVGHADFDGDGSDDLLWRRNDGVLSLWTIASDRIASRTVVAGPDAAWQIAGVEDYSGDGRADLLFKNSAGALSIWTMNGSTVVTRGIIGSVDNQWQVIP